jgi:hypothetical protein
MGFLKGITDKLKGGLRYTLCQGLRDADIQARVVERGRKEETIAGGLLGNSLGVLEIRDTPVRWVNIIEHPGSRFAPTTHTNVYIVPDEQLHGGGYFDLRSVPVRSSSVHGRVIDLRWEASFTGSRLSIATGDTQNTREQRLAELFTGDTALTERLIRLGDTIRIRSVPNYWCWAISSGSYEVGRSGPEETGMVPSVEQWDCYLTIARHLTDFSAEG